MDMRRRVLSTVIMIAIGVCALDVAGVEAQDGTIPTRTPTPIPGQTTPVNPTATSDDPGNPPPPAATQTTGAPGATATATLQSPAGGATAVGTTAAQTPATLLGASQIETPACDDTPVIRASRRMAVYAGSGGDYEILAALETGETRVILGRAGFADWWQIELTPGVTAWVDDEDVTVHGNVALVPVVEPPAINGAPPTRGPAWNPTPPPFTPCGPTATPSPTPTATATGTTTPAAAEDRAGTGAGAAEAKATATPATAGTTGSATPAGAVIAAATGAGVTARGAEASRAASPTSAVNLVLPIAGLALIGGGIILALMARNRGAKPPDAPK